MKLRYLILILFGIFISLGSLVYFLPENEILILLFIQILVLIVTFNIVLYAIIRLIQRISYRFYLVIRWIFFNIIKLGFSFLIVGIILDIISPVQGEIGNVNIIYFAIIPLIAIVLVVYLVLNLILKLLSYIEHLRVYRILRNLFWVYLVGLVIAGILSVRFVSNVNGELVSNELYIFGLVPILFVTLVAAAILYLLYIIFWRLFYIKGIWL